MLSDLESGNSFEVSPPLSEWYSIECDKKVDKNSSHSQSRANHKPEFFYQTVQTCANQDGWVAGPWGVVWVTGAYRVGGCVGMVLLGMTGTPSLPEPDIWTMASLDYGLRGWESPKERTKRPVLVGQTGSSGHEAVVTSGVTFLYLQSYAQTRQSGGSPPAPPGSHVHAEDTS